MTARVPQYPPKIYTEAFETNDIRAATPVRGDSQWKRMGLAANWLLGSGGSVVVAGPTRNRIAVTTGTYVMQFYSWPRSENTARIWFLALRAERSNYNPIPVSGRIRAQAVGNAETVSREFSLPTGQAARAQIVSVLDELTLSTVGAVAMSFEVTQDASTNGWLYVDSVACYEIPRAELDASASSIGAEIDSLKRDAPIYYDSGNLKLSTEGVLDAAADAKTIARRNVMFHWYNGEGVTSSTTAASGTSNIFYLDPAVQCRLLGNGDTTDDVAWTVYARRASGAGNVYVRCVAASGATSTITISTTAAAWATPKTFAVETDQLNTTAFIRGGTRDTLTFELYHDSGTVGVLYGISVGEPRG